jgi:hypothetical protein
MMSKVAKLLFPQLSPSQRRREMRVLSAAVLVGLAVAGMIGFLIVIMQQNGRI